MKATRDKLATETPDSWTESATRALAQLIRMETYASSNTPAVATESAASLDTMAQYALIKKDYDTFNAKHGKALQESLNFLYGTKEGGGHWPPVGISADSENNGMAVIDKGIRTFNDYWRRQVAGQSQRLNEINNLVDALKKFRQAEADVATMAKNPTENSDQFRSFKDNWVKGFAAMSSGKSEADRAIENLSKDGGWSDTQSLANVFDTELSRITADASRAYQTLLNDLPAEDKGKTPPNLASIRSLLKDLMAKVPPSATTLAGTDEEGWALR
jgi:hypothetical protein